MSNPPKPPKPRHLEILSDAVQRWYRFYEESADEEITRVLALAAMKAYDDGYRTAAEIATILIGTYVGAVSTRANASSSGVVH